MEPTSNTEPTPNGQTAPAAEPDFKAQYQTLADTVEAQNRDNQSLRTELARMQGRLDGIGTAAPEDEFEESAAAGDPYDDESPEALFEALSKDGRGALAKRGFIHRSELAALVEPMVEKIAAKRVGEQMAVATRDAAFQRDFGELADPKSELFAETKILLDEMCSQDPSLRNNMTALETAARAARAVLKTRGQAGSAKPRAEGNQDEDRRRRVAAQAGDRGRPVVDEANDELTDQQRMIAEKMDISPEAYRKRALAGSRMGGTPRRMN
jgi:hypothetical protein